MNKKVLKKKLLPDLMDSPDIFWWKYMSHGHNI